MTFDQLIAQTWKVTPYDPAERKYYGTTVGLPNGRQIEVWIGDNYKTPSKRELAAGWDHQIDGFDHVEQEEDLKIATLIAQAPVLYRFAKEMFSQKAAPGTSDICFEAGAALREIDEA